MTPAVRDRRAAGGPGRAAARAVPARPDRDDVDPRVDPALDDAAPRRSSRLWPRPPTTPSSDDLDDLLYAARRERDEYLDMSRRVQADFENYKKRMLRQQTDHLERAAEDLVTKVLPVLDAFDLARAHLGDGEELSAEGKALVAGSTLLADTLGPRGPRAHRRRRRALRPHHPRSGGPRAADAAVPRRTPVPVQTRPARRPVRRDEGPVVDEVLRAGYRWKGRVIRPAMVRVRG